MLYDGMLSPSQVLLHSTAPSAVLCSLISMRWLKIKSVSIFHHIAEWRCIGHKLCWSTAPPIRIPGMFHFFRACFCPQYCCDLTDHHHFFFFMNTLPFYLQSRFVNLFSILVYFLWSYRSLNFL